jgi:hypothetical protein
MIVRLAGAFEEYVYLRIDAGAAVAFKICASTKGKPVYPGGCIPLEIPATPIGIGNA